MNQKAAAGVHNAVMPAKRHASVKRHTVRDTDPIYHTGNKDRHMSMAQTRTGMGMPLSMPEK